MDRGARWATVHGVAKSQTQLSTHTHTQGDLGLICVTVGIVQTRGQTAELTASNINEKSLLLPNRL